MNINVETLKGQVKAYRDRVAEARERWESNVAAAESDFIEKHGDKAAWIEEWRDYRDRLTNELRRANPNFLEVKVPRTSPPSFHRGRWRRNYDNRRTWDQASHGYGPPPTVDMEVESLSAFLDTVDDVTISTSALSSAGFRNFKNLYQALGGTA